MNEQARIQLINAVGFFIAGMVIVCILGAVLPRVFPPAEQQAKPAPTTQQPR